MTFADLTPEQVLQSAINSITDPDQLTEFVTALQAVVAARSTERPY